MNKNLVGGVIAVIGVLIGAGLFYNNAVKPAVPQKGETAITGGLENGESAGESATQQVEIAEEETSTPSETISEKPSTDEPLQAPAKNQPASSSPTASLQPQSAPSLPKSEISRFTIVSDESRVQFAVKEVLRGEDFTAVGTTGKITGEVSVDLANAARTASLKNIAIDASTLATDSGGRDNAIRLFILKTNNEANRMITFRMQAIEGLSETLSVGVSVPVTIRGQLTIAGVTRPAAFRGDLRLESLERLTATVSATVSRKDFGIGIPDVPFVASVDDSVLLSGTIVAQKGK